MKKGLRYKGTQRSRGPANGTRRTVPGALQIRRTLYLYPFLRAAPELTLVLRSQTTGRGDIDKQDCLVLQIFQRDGSSGLLYLKTWCRTEQCMKNSGEHDSRLDRRGTFWQMS